MCPKQELFALGLLKIRQTEIFEEQLFRLRDLALTKVSPVEKPFEFKFSSITASSYRFYLKLIDLYLQFPEFQFCCLIFDKSNKQIDITKYFPNSWDAYIRYSKLLIANNIQPNDKICIVADFYQKPKANNKYYEAEIKKIENVYNVCMLESHASLFIQTVDVLLGCVVRAYKHFFSPAEYHHIYKNKVSDYLKVRLNRTTLVGNFTIHTPNYFSVWEFKPKN